MGINLKSKSGFTLIELLVVVAIIGLLASVVLASLNSARAKARDARRKEDLHNIRLALEFYRDTYGAYPPTKSQTLCGGTDSWAESNGNCGGQWLTTDVNFYNYMKNVPVDPLNTGVNAGWGDGNYVYSYTVSGGDNYELIAQLENTGDKSSCGVTPAYYHNVTPNLPWCAPWPNNMGRSQNIISDH
jgi:type II secretion system protein G